MDLKAEQILKVKLHAKPMKEAISSMLNPRPFVFYYGSDEVIESVLLPEDPTSRLYRLGKVFNESKLLVDVSTLWAFMFPFKISNLVISFNKKWSISDGLVIRALARKLEEDSICILAGPDPSELVLAGERLIHGLVPFKLLIGYDYSLLLGYLKRVEE